MSETLLEDDNLTRAYVAGAVASRRRHVPLEVNPALASLSALLVESGENELVIRFTAPRHGTQGNGVVGGGTLANMLDLAMATSVLSQLEPGYTCATISLTVNMQSAGQEGSLRWRAWTESGGRSLSHTRSCMTQSAPA